MINQEQKRAFHKAQLYRLLIKMLDDEYVASNIFFKGGTCSALLGFLDRFSVDLDFDLKKGADKAELRQRLHRIFKQSNLEIKDESKRVLQFFLRYQAPLEQRNTIKLDIIDNPFKKIDYTAQHLKDLDRMAFCQTLESIFANKLVALTDRYKKTGAIAGRDVYDIHHFFTRGFNYNKEVIEERTGKTLVEYFIELKDFIKGKVSQTVIDQDLNFLLPYQEFNAIRKTLKTETLMLLQDELKRLS